MNNNFSIKEILKRIIEELDSKINHIIKPKAEEKAKYTKFWFFKNKMADFPISKDTYYNYVAFTDPRKKRKENAKPKSVDSISLKAFYEICTYTGVSADYFLGFIKSKRKEQSAEMVRKEFGLSDKSMENLTAIKNKNAKVPGELSSNIINFILENNSFWNELDSLLPMYLAENYLNESSDYVSRVNFELSEAFIHLIDDVCKSILMALADAEKNGHSIFDDGTKKDRSYQNIIKETQKKGWKCLKNEAETITE